MPPKKVTAAAAAPTSSASKRKSASSSSADAEPAKRGRAKSPAAAKAAAPKAKAPKKAAPKAKAAKKAAPAASKKAKASKALVAAASSASEDGEEGDDSEGSCDYIIYASDEESSDYESVAQETLDAIEAAQEALNKVDDEVAEESARLARLAYKRKPEHLKKRDELIKQLPHFWKNLLINNRALFPVLEHDIDGDILNFLVGLSVEEFFSEPAKAAGKAKAKKAKAEAEEENQGEVSGYYIHMDFSNDNPYFSHPRVSKKFLFNHSAGYADVSVSPCPIQWHDENFEQHYPDSFFVGWTSPDVEDEDEQMRNDAVDIRIGEIIREEIYRDPVAASQDIDDSEDEDDEEGDYEDDEDDEDDYDVEDFVGSEDDDEIDSDLVQDSDEEEEEEDQE